MFEFLFVIEVVCVCFSLPLRFSVPTFFHLSPVFFPLVFIGGTYRDLAFSFVFEVMCVCFPPAAVFSSCSLSFVLIPFSLHLFLWGYLSRLDFSFVFEVVFVSFSLPRWFSLPTFFRLPPVFFPMVLKGVLIETLLLHSFSSWGVFLFPSSAVLSSRFLSTSSRFLSISLYGGSLVVGNVFAYVSSVCLGGEENGKPSRRGTVLVGDSRSSYERDKLLALPCTE